MTYQPLPHEQPDAQVPGAFAVPPTQVTSRQARRDAARRGVRLATVGLGAAALFGTGAVVTIVASGNEAAQAATDSANNSQSSSQSSSTSADEDSEHWDSSQGSDDSDHSEETDRSDDSDDAATSSGSGQAAVQAPTTAAQAPAAATHTS